MSTTTITVPQPSGAEQTSEENAEHGFLASQSLADDLQAVLIDLTALHLVGKQAHWNIVGPNFRDLHLNLDEVVGIARASSDDVAERMRALHATPDGRPAVIAAQTTLPEFPQGEVLTHDAIDLITRAIESTVATMRRVHDAVDAADPTSADILHGVIEKLEQQAWFISAETRRPSN
ncbi:Dps family protein [Mycetocola reblochoni]|uniref:Non-specific DNA-binding protein Dps / Iron-binding ferritin-like antioxidant protein / Ferroxidase n=2 Tax=Mycetocola reblochoni TaxID=331618 RepID=A0A1R4KDZ0_9MICO|nr:DNA starvation/stationary phase protection protein [Mycetocola reblochoni]RLP71241.1 DNA starvation/stationary phase protection protein [Mycetocola reblochoni]SJN42233.1 Non-specific DNA-binding protein Dps / Iron-binding ferritin-like antioxidant protein / Ferroxidase [Mycetocola reblochoni REB411]